MSPFNDSPTIHQSSSTSTVSSGTTLTNNIIVSEVMPPQSSSLFTQAINTNKEYQHTHKTYQISEAINTDYESSANEDFETYPSYKYKNAEFAFLSYSRTNKLEKLQALLEAKLKNDISLALNFKGQQKQNFSWSALHLACYFGHIRVVEEILSKKQFREEIDINIQNNSGDTPLHKATLTNRIQLVQLLLSYGANVFIKNCDGLLANQLTNDKHIINMLEAAKQVDKNRLSQEMFKAADNGDLEKLQEYFENYVSSSDAPQTRNEDLVNKLDSENEKHPGSSRSSNDFVHEDLMTDKITDERGNTLLHLAAMRGFEAICIYLLEKGFDPYKKNNLGKSCIDLSSYQLRQLFTTVKPTNNQLKKLTNQRVTRFEGPLLKKVRILGWRQIYVVLENGVIMLFNNRKDSMNKSRRGYKYLESATCEPEFNDLGAFTVCFSDNSRATFLITSDHLNNYASFKISSSDQDKSANSGSQVELVRQKWIDSIRDHVKYSTDFIRNGLKLNYNEDESTTCKDDGDLTIINHLLPIDTIKSFIQEARAHYSILNRHAESLCNLVQSISSSSQLTHSIESSRIDESKNVEQQSAVTLTNTGSRLLDLIRPLRQIRGNSISGDDEVSIQSQQALVNKSNRRRNDSLTYGFIQDDWHCILFHLRLLVESTENTRVSMGQALALMEHQEQLRQNRIQDQDERCRVLEDSLQALAKHHHDLERSISMSQIYHSAAARSISLSTDLNEYFDAFEDFDDEKTMTPNSMPSDEDLHQKIQDVIDEVEHINEPIMKVSSSETLYESHHQFKDELLHQTSKDIIDEDEEDDLRSNCSALTVETTSDQ